MPVCYKNISEEHEMPIQLYVLLLHQMEHPHLYMLCSVQASCTKQIWKNAVMM
jgi:hypothetical protein